MDHTKLWSVAYCIFPRIRRSISKSTTLGLSGWKTSIIQDPCLSRSPTLSRNGHTINMSYAVLMWHALTARDDLDSSLGQAERRCRMLFPQERMMTLIMMAIVTHCTIRPLPPTSQPLSIQLSWLTTAVMADGKFSDSHISRPPPRLWGRKTAQNFSTYTREYTVDLQSDCQ